jgi:hypothetical protein
MTDLDPEIWDNPTLGAAAPNENLDRLERQQIEDRAAKFEDREPREIVVENNYPGWTPEVNERTGTIPSNYQTVHFADENPNDIPVDSGRPDEDAGTVQEPETETDEETDSGTTEDSPESDGDPQPGDGFAVENPDGTPDGESESTQSDSTEEGNSTQWT